MNLTDFKILYESAPIMWGYACLSLILLSLVLERFLMFYVLSKKIDPIKNRKKIHMFIKILVGAVFLYALQVMVNRGFFINAESSTDAEVFLKPIASESMRYVELVACSIIFICFGGYMFFLNKGNKSDTGFYSK